MQCDLTLRQGSEEQRSSIRKLRGFAVLLLALSLAACGEGDGNGFAGNPNGGGGSGGGGSGWTSGVFLPAGTFQAQCANPRSAPWPDVQGTSTDENNFLRSYSNDTYLWYDEIIDQDPALFDTPTYFDELVTDELTPSGNFKDNFHFTFDTDEWIELSQSGVSGGYGANFAVLEASPPRLIVVAYTDPGTPAANNNLARGAEIVTVDGIDVVNGTEVDMLNAGLFPASDGEIHNFEVLDLGAQNTRTFAMTSASITSTPVQNVGTIPTATGDVGYLLFNDHIATAEQGLIDAVNQLDAANVTDLIVDIRYNGGGFLDIAAEFAYMIAGGVPTAGQNFERLQFNDKHPATNPITGAPLTPVPFHNTNLGFNNSPDTGMPLPTLELPRVYVLTGPGTCSASEAIMNGLRGVNVEVIQIGSTTCGKPYGFYPTDNCGTTYFTIQFRGVNAMNFGDYSDGFSPANNPEGTVVPGCSVGDDFSAALGDPTEGRLAAALQYRADGTCPAASGIGAPPGLSKLTLQSDDNVIVPKSAWQQNRIMRR